MSKKGKLDVLIVGGGSFGTALGTILAEMKKRVLLWVRREDQAREINRRHTNRKYIPDYKLPPALEATTDLAGSIKRTRAVLMAIPSRSFREVARAIGDQIEGDQILVHTTKGFEIETFKRMSTILREETCPLKIGVLSGPNLSAELMAGHPAGATVASHYDEVIRTIQGLFKDSRMRVYGGHDVVGTEVGGAFKNILAVASGMAVGTGFGDNTKALLLTRGLSEMARVGVALGADVFTFCGLTGIGDLICTCSSPLSRNYSVGNRLAKGETLDEILDSMNQVAEGVPTTAAVQKHATTIGLDLPIVRAVHDVLYKGQTVLKAVKKLMIIPTGDELSALQYR